MISIIIPVYNQAEHLNNCLRSIKDQSLDDFEIIIVDDGSKDDIESVIKKHQRIFGSNLSYYYQKNSGASSARNKGAGLARGEYIIFCDADIVMTANMLEI